MKYYNTLLSSKAEFLKARGVKPIDVYDIGKNQKGYTFVRDIGLADGLELYKKKRKVVM